MTKQVAFVAPLPPPVHGFSNICAAMLERLKARTAVTVFNRAPRTDNTFRSIFRPFTNFIVYCKWCAKNAKADLYLGLSGGLGQLLDWPYLVIGKAFRRRLFIHHHSFAYINAPSIFNRFLFLFLRDETHLVLSRRMGSELIRIYRLDPSKVRVVSNAAFFDAVAEDPRSPYDGVPIRVGYLSAISLEKGIAEFFAVLAELKRLGIPYSGHIAGPVTSAAQSEFDRFLGSSKNVSYSGPVYGDEKAAFYRNLDVLLFPSDYANEAEPLVIHEAMRSGVYVIACARGAISEMLSHGAGVACAKSAFFATAVDRIRSFSIDPPGLREAQRLSLEQARRMRDAGIAELSLLLDKIAGAAEGWNERAKPSVRAITVTVFAATFALGICNKAIGDVANNDTLEKAVQPPEATLGQEGNNLGYFVGAQTAYDTNLFRLPNGADLATIVGPRASREDHIDTGSLGLDGIWTLGKQIVTLDVRADYNRFLRNDNLNNFSSNDALKWNWAFGSRLSGAVGADYVRTLGGFYNTNNYQRDMVNVTETFGSARFVVGPHVALFGGVLYTDVSLSQPALKVNDNKRKAVDLGLEYALGAASSVDFDYRYTDARYSHTSFLNGVAFDPDYRDDTARVTFRDALSEKTHIEALVGYLKRTYPSTAIGAFSGNIWRVSLDWKPTDKTDLLVAASRDLQADLSAQSDYFVSKAVSVSPTWTPTEKISVALVLARDTQDFIGVNEFVATVGSRHDSINSGQLNVLYSPFVFTQSRSLTFNFSYRTERRKSDQANLSYADNLAKAGVTFKF
jgi:glycosyltransferase involved in cell wall biosynthesis